MVRLIIKLDMEWIFMSYEYMNEKQAKALVQGFQRVRRLKDLDISIEFLELGEFWNEPV